MAYAENTDVSSDKSRGEIERILRRYGASQFGYGWDQQMAMVGFVANNRQIKFTLPMPDRNARKFTQTPTGRTRSKTQADAEYEQAIRQRWRALVIIIKAKLEAVEAGVSTFEDEFAMQMVLPTGQSVRDYVLPAVADAYEKGTVPGLFSGGGLRELER